MKIQSSIEKQSIDGSEWKRYRTSAWIEILVTSAFMDIMRHGQPNAIDDGEGVSSGVLRLLRQYRWSVELNEYDHSRTYIANWDDAALYRIWDSNLCVREEIRTWSSEDKLYRMDLIQHLMELGSLPRWIKSPAHYWLIKVPAMNQGLFNKFMFMEMIDAGVTSWDIIDHPRTTEIEESIIENFWHTYWFNSIGDVSYKSFQTEVFQKYKEVRLLLEQAFETNKDVFKWWTFEQLFTDLFQRNLLVTHNPTPIANSKMSFWVIDQ